MRFTPKAELCDKPCKGLKVAKKIFYSKNSIWPNLSEVTTDFSDPSLNITSGNDLVFLVLAEKVNIKPSMIQPFPQITASTAQDLKSDQQYWGVGVPGKGQEVNSEGDTLARIYYFEKQTTSHISSTGRFSFGRGYHGQSGGGLYNKSLDKLKGVFSLASYEPDPLAYWTFFKIFNTTDVQLYQNILKNIEILKDASTEAANKNAINLLYENIDKEDVNLYMF
ncbi:MAG: hypothetical protein ACOYOK_03595 [Pseudobdellovibrionaceae bacterium]